MTGIIDTIKGNIFWAYKGLRFGYEPLVNLGKSQWWPYERLAAFQNERLRRIVRYAYLSVPSYRRKFDDAGVSPEDVRTMNDLCKLPLTTREEMQQDPGFVNRALVTDVMYTGGSTGSSLTYYESYEAGKMRWSSHCRGWGWMGYSHGKGRLAIVTSLQGSLPGGKIINLCGDLCLENIRENVSLLTTHRPEFIRGYTSSLYILARHCLEEGIKISFVKGINSISENLYDYQRAVIEDAFHCRVFEEYCCNDGGACAWECEEHAGLHYAMERAVIEEIDGEMVVTDLWNKAMPFIRYRNGDAVRFLDDTCPCGRALPLIRVKGRTNDILISREGPVSPTYIFHNWYDGSRFETGVDFRRGIGVIQFVQKKGYLLEIYLVKTPAWNGEMEKAFLASMTLIFKGMEIKLNVVSSIPATAKGKRHFVINEDADLLNKWQNE